jgi:hypothetical protein
MCEVFVGAAVIVTGFFIELRAMPGTHIAAACSDAIAFAGKVNDDLILVFNERRLHITPDTNLEDVTREYAAITSRESVSL